MTNPQGSVEKLRPQECPKTAHTVLRGATLKDSNCPYELIFHAHIEENRIDPFCFIKKNIVSSLFGETLKLRLLTLQ